jgi:RimJ/RimL family protein N-acetyltransferase
MVSGARTMGDIVLETERLVLRTIDESDAALQYAVLNSPMVMQHLGGRKELHEIEAKHAKSMAWYAQGGFGFLLLIEKGSGELVGHAGLKKVDNEHAPNLGDFEIGWLIREDRWRRGYASEAMRAVLEWAFTRHSARHVVALTSKANVPSWKLMEKLGMVRREDLDFIDPAYAPQDNPTIQYSLTHDQWEAHA